jgi:GTP cyclohydrolase I
MTELVDSDTGDKLPDHASERDDRALGIDRVGIKDLSYPIQVHDRFHSVQHTVARVNLYVSLPHDFKGTHMSRFIEVLNARRGMVTIQNMPSILSDIQARLEADVAHIELTFPYFISKHAPVSKVESLMEYICTFKATKRGPHVDFVLCVRVPVKSLCPCSKSISDRGAHNQRSIVDVEVRSEGDRFVWIEEVVDAVERCASAPLYALLKREDEKYVTELAYDNPKFVEDLVRDVVLAVRGLGGVRWLRVAAENQESIHNHAAYAEIVWSAEEAGQDEERHAGAQPDPEETEPFGPWLRGLRVGRGYSQQAFADLLGVTGAHMSRVESGDKGLSDIALRRAAELLGLDAFDVCLRAGVVPPELLAALRARPTAAREWLRSEEG